MSHHDIIAWRGKHAISQQEFNQRIAHWKSLLEKTPGQKFALYLRDSLEFASALLGAWLARKIIYLPGNILPATCKSLNSIVDGYLGEFPPDYSPLILKNPEQKLSLL